MPERLMPLVNYVDLNTQRGVVAILWTIRQAGEISYPKLYEAVFGQPVDQSVDGFKTPTVNLQQVFAFHNALIELFRNGIIETTEPTAEHVVIQLFQQYDPGSKQGNIKLKITERVSYIQYLFDVSLSEITLKGKPLKSHPVFGEPIDDFDHKWSDIFLIMPLS